MSGEETRFIEDLPPGSSQVLQALAGVDLHALSVDELVAAAGMPRRDVRAAVTTLVKAGWLTTARAGRFALAINIRDAAAETNASVESRDIRRRFIEYLRGGVRAALRAQGRFSAQLGELRAGADMPSVRLVDGVDATAWLADHLSSLLVAVRIGTQDGLHELAARLAAAVWEAAPDVLDLQRCQELSQWGEEASIRWQNPQFLATLLDHSARFLRRAEDLRGAEGQWIRALAIGRRLRDSKIAFAALESLGELYGEWGRPHRRLDAELELLAWQQRAGNELDVVRAQVRIGSTMLSVGRAGSALEHFLQAERGLSMLGDAAAQEHADVLIMLGRVHWQMGAAGTARRCFSQALTILVDLDAAAADRVRVLLRTENGRPLPAPSAIDEQMH